MIAILNAPGPGRNHRLRSPTRGRMAGRSGSRIIPAGLRGRIPIRPPEPTAAPASMRKIRLQKNASARLLEQFARDLNGPQREAATAPDGFNLILAGPGSG